MSQKNISKFATLLFLLISCIEIVGVAIDSALIQLLFKPLIIPSLILLYYCSAQKRNYWYIAALFFSFLGDVFLLDKQDYFLFGVGAFLVTQLLYIKLMLGQVKDAKWVQVIFAAIPFGIYLSVFLSVLKPNLGELFVPVFVYGLSLSLFGALALLNLILKRDQWSWILFVGALLFILSDSMIALNKFHEARDFYAVSIMVTYVSAQFLIYQYMSRRI